MNGRTDLRNLKRIVGVAAIVLASAMAAPTAATAQPTDFEPTIAGGCGSGAFCFFINANYSIPSEAGSFGYRVVFRPGDGKRAFNLDPAVGGATFQNNVESVKNASSRRVCLYSIDNRDNPLLEQVAPNTNRATLTHPNQADAWREVAGACPPRYLLD